MKSRNEIFEILRKELPLSEEEISCQTIGLFGSYAREERAGKSDVDLLEDYLSNKLGVKVEVVTPGGIKERMKPYIMRDVVYV